jgi:hypothetical protein
MPTCLVQPPADDSSDLLVLTDDQALGILGFTAPTGEKGMRQPRRATSGRSS